MWKTRHKISVSYTDIFYNVAYVILRNFFRFVADNIELSEAKDYVTHSSLI